MRLNLNLVTQKYACHLITLMALTITQIAITTARHRACWILRAVAVASECAQRAVHIVAAIFVTGRTCIAQFVCTVDDDFCMCF